MGSVFPTSRPPQTLITVYLRYMLLLMRPAQTKSEKMIKVDHAGENGAVNIYRAQKLVARLRAPSLLEELIDFQKHEEHHRDIFADYLKTRSIRRCVSYHLCGLGGFALGMITGIIGKQAIFATTYAVENVVLQHLKHQMEYLEGTDDVAFNCVNEIFIDEQQHHDTARDNLDTDSILSRLLIRIVKLCTEAVIRFGMR